MVRPHPPVPSSLRNRNRITNKSRLRIHFGNVDVDPLIPDEDEEKTRLAQSVLGVDQEDANEHHLQQVLNEAALRNQSTQRASRDKAAKESSAAYIPTPDSTGVVSNYAPVVRLKRPPRDRESYVQSSETVEEACSLGLAHGCTYFMDERDKEWLDRNNEEGRGEGTSAQAAMASGTRASGRSAKARGKEPDTGVATVMSDDHFELVMGLFELITHEETEYLEHSFQEGMPFPSFTSYQDTFTNPLLPQHFATCMVPNGIPPGPQLVRMARCIYPHWKERRIERGGKRIIPQLNGDESDTLNESYICFRRREVKAVRKTRGSQVNTSERLMSLQKQLNEPLTLAKFVLKRENLKRDSTFLSMNIWQRRVAVVDMNRRVPGLVEKADEELLVDKDLPQLKKIETRPRVPIRTEPGTPAPLSSVTRLEQAVRPSARAAHITNDIEMDLQKRKEKDHQWEDVVDNPYVSSFTPFTSRLFKYLPSPAKSSDEETLPAVRQPRPVRLRRGRGGRMHLDRREVNNSLPNHRARVRDDAMDVDQANTEADQLIQSRWRFDADDSPIVGPGGSDEQDRTLLEDCDVKLGPYNLKLLAEVDALLVTDPSLSKFGPDGRKETIIPFRLGGSATTVMRRDVSRPTPQQQQPMISQAAQQAQAQAQAQAVAAAAQQQNGNGTPVSMQQQIKMPNGGGGGHMRISNGGGMRPNGMQSSSPPNSASPTHPGMQFSPPPVSATGTRPSMNMPHIEPAKADSTFAVPQPQQAVPHAPESIINGNYITRPKSQEPNHVNNYNNLSYQVNNGHHGQAINNAQFQSAGLSLQQMQSLKTILASQQGQEMHANGMPMRQIPAYMHPNFNVNGMKLPNVRQQQQQQQAQWSPASPMQRPASAMNGNGGGYDGGASISPHMGQATPVRTPSRMMHSPHMAQTSPSPLPITSQSPRPTPSSQPIY